MNYNVIQQLLENGISEDEIINSLYKAVPKLGKKIGKLLSGGWSSKDILNYFSKDKEAQKTLKQNFKPTTPSEMAAMRLRDSYTNIPKSSNQQQLEELQELTKNAAPLALGAVAPFVGRAAVPMAEAALGRALPKNTPLAQQALGSLLSPSLKGSQTPPPSNVLQQPQQPPNVNAGNMPQGGNIPQAKTSITDILTKFKGLPEQIEKLKASGNGPEEIAAYLKKFQPKYAENLEKEAGRPIEEVISEYLASKPVEQAAISPQPVEKPEEIAHVPELQGTEQPTKEPIPETAKPEEAKEPEEPAKPIAKKDIVASPQGVGEVLEIRNGKALVEVNGKKHVIPEDELEPEPKDIIQTVQQLLKIPEVDRSSVVSLFTYDPEENKMYIQFHTGDTYKYLDVDPEKVMTVANKMGIPVTKGQNIFGAWSPEDKQSLGATLIKEIINDPKYKKAKKGEEPNPNYIKLETLYDYWEKLRKKPKRKRL